MAWIQNIRIRKDNVSLIGKCGRSCGTLARVIAVSSGKGGVGKTTVSMNLGTVLAHHFKRKVTLIDCNVTTSHLGMYLGMYYSPITLNKVLRGEVSMKEAVYQHVGGMKVIPASLSISDLEGVDVTRLREKINSIADDNEIILLDAAPGLGREAIASLRAADEVLFVTTPYVPAVMDIIRTMEVVNELGTKPIGIVLNMVNRENYEMAPQEVEQLTRLPVVASIPYDKNVHKSLVEKVPVVIFKPDSKASKSLLRFGAGIIGHPMARKKSLASRIFGRFRRGRRKKKVDMPPAMLSPSMEDMELPTPESQVFQDQKIMTQGMNTQPTRQTPPRSRPDSPSSPPGFPGPGIKRPEMPRFDDEEE
jgi:septum site-determining protein MinD